MIIEKAPPSMGTVGCDGEPYTWRRQPEKWRPIGTCQQLWDTRELHLVSLDYGGETREVGAIDVNIDQDLVA